MIVDVVRTCYKRRFYFFQDDRTRATEITYYRAPDGARFFPFPIAWSSSIWDSADEQAQVELGEDPYIKTWVNGKTPFGATGQAFCGTKEQWQGAINFADHPDPVPRWANGLMQCCRPAIIPDLIALSSPDQSNGRIALQVIPSAASSPLGLTTFPRPSGELGLTSPSSPAVAALAMQSALPIGHTDSIKQASGLPYGLNAPVDSLTMIPILFSIHLSAPGYAFDGAVIALLGGLSLSGIWEWRNPVSVPIPGGHVDGGMDSDPLAPGQCLPIMSSVYGGDLYESQPVYHAPTSTNPWAFSITLALNKNGVPTGDSVTISVYSIP